MCGITITFVTICRLHQQSKLSQSLDLVSLVYIKKSFETKILDRFNTMLEKITMLAGVKA